MKYQVIIGILMLLLSRKRLTAKEIADRYGICTRSVYRYIDELNVCGVPIDISRGRYGGHTYCRHFPSAHGIFYA